MKVLILGGGITGLSAAWSLFRNYPKAQITLLEKQNRLGGWIQTSREGGFLFEKGPRTFPLGRNPHLLQLIRELKLDIITAPSQKRYLWYRGRLRSIGSLIPRIIPALIKEPFIKPAACLDESIYDFASRRFSPFVAETLFDPMTLGIYAGDIRKLSVRACFPSLFRWEREKGSVLRGLFTAPKKAKGLFTLTKGMDTLITELQKRLPVEFVLNCKVESIQENQVMAGGKIWHADKIISALPPSLPSKSLWVVNLAYVGSVLPKTGYGYLVPSSEKESILGMIWDSCVFPQQNTRGETRLTAMIRAEEKEPMQAALWAAEKHLKINVKPLYISQFLAENAIPQFEVGCDYPYGVSVDACVERGIKIFTAETQRTQRASEKVYLFL